MTSFYTFHTIIHRWREAEVEYGGGDMEQERGEDQPAH
jgi:hypothetical protein